MLKNKFIIVLLSLLFLAQMAQAQTYYKHNFDLTCGGGLQAATFTPENGGTQNNKFGGVVNAIYRFQFSKHWGIGTGLGLSFYKVESKYDSLLVTNNVTDDETGQEYESRATFHNWTEDQTMVNLEIPLALYFQAPISDKASFLADLGAKVIIPLKSQFKSVDGSYETTGYFDDTNIEYYDLPQHGFSKHDYTSGSSDSKTISTAGFVDLGMLVKHFYFGVYASYTLTDLAKKGDDQLYNGKEYKGIMSSSVDNAHLMSVGVKIGLSFGGPRKVVRDPNVMDLEQTVNTNAEPVRVMDMPKEKSSTDPERGKVMQMPKDKSSNETSKEKPKQLETSQPNQDEAAKEVMRLEKERKELNKEDAKQVKNQKPAVFKYQ